MTRILHVLDHSLPAHSGYTFRTRALMKAQLAKGWEVAGITGVAAHVSGLWVIVELSGGRYLVSAPTIAFSVVVPMLAVLGPAWIAYRVLLRRARARWSEDWRAVLGDEEVAQIGASFD